MKRKWRQLGITAAATLAIATTTTGLPLNPQPTYAATAAKATKTVTIPSIASQKVMLDGKSYVTFRDAQFLMQDQGKVIAFTLSYTNVGSKKIDLLDYWVSLKNASGKAYTVKQPDGDKSIKSINPYSTTNVTYYAYVDDDTSINDLKFNMVKWDFSVTGFTRNLGTFQYPKGASEKVEPLKEKVMLYASSKVKGTIESYELTSGEDNAYADISFRLENAGYKSMQLSNLKFYLQTGDQTYVYDVATDDLTKLNLQPNEQKSVTLNATLPNGVDTKDMVLVVAQAGNGTVPDLPIGVYKLPGQNTQGNQQPAGKIGSQAAYKDYSVQLASIERMYADDHDSIVAKVTVTNKSVDTLEVPNFGGYLTVNGVKLSDANVAKLDQRVLLNPNQSYSYYVFSDISTSLTINQVGFTATDLGDGKSEAKTISKFSDNQLSKVGQLAYDKPYIVDSVGQKSQFTLLDSEIYPGEKFDYYYGEFEYRNDENRSVNPAEIGGYLQSTGKAVIPITFTAYADKVFPDGKVLISGFAKVPKNYLTTDVKLTVGRSVKSTDANGKAKSTVVNPATYSIITSGNFGTKTDLTEIHYLNYVLNLQNFYTSLHGKVEGFTFDGLNLSFYYDLYNTVEYESGMEDHKLLIEFVDAQNAKATYSKELTFDESSPDGEYLKEGTGIAKTVTFMDSNIINNITMSKYQVNIYHVYKGNKMLIATKEMIW